MILDKQAKIYIAGHRGLVGGAVLRKLDQDGFSHLIVRNKQDLDLSKQDQVIHFFEKERPEYVFLAAAKVGGILANSNYPADFIYSNLAIQNNVIHQSYMTGVKKLLFLGSSCIYPKIAPQPISEDALLSGSLEPTNEPYAIAKIAGIKTCQAYRRQYGCNFISVMPTNLYGPGDNFDLSTSHVLPALVKKLHEAKANETPIVSIWGTGKPRREFLFVDDLADACIFLMQNYDKGEILNIGLGEDLSIHDLAKMVASVVDYKGDLIYDTSKPDGTPRKLLDVNRIHALGWKAKFSLLEGLSMTYEWYLKHEAHL